MILLVITKIYASLSEEEYKKLRAKLDVKDINNIDMIEEKLNIINIDEINWRAMRQQSAVAKGINMNELNRKQGQINYVNNTNKDSNYELKKKMKRIKDPFKFNPHHQAQMGNWDQCDTPPEICERF